jgi:hypothetical protein
VFEELRGRSGLDRRTACWLSMAATAGTPHETARRYAAIVVTASVRRQIKSWASLLAATASTAREAELEVTNENFTAKIADTFGRLAVLRMGLE